MHVLIQVRLPTKSDKPSSGRGLETDVAKKSVSKISHSCIVLQTLVIVHTHIHTCAHMYIQVAITVIPSVHDLNLYQ